MSDQIEMNNKLRKLLDETQNQKEMLKVQQDEFSTRVVLASSTCQRRLRDELNPRQFEAYPQR